MSSRNCFHSLLIKSCNHKQADEFFQTGLAYLLISSHIFQVHVYIRLCLHRIQPSSWSVQCLAATHVRHGCSPACWALAHCCYSLACFISCTIVKPFCIFLTHCPFARPASLGSSHVLGVAFIVQSV